MKIRRKKTTSEKRGKQLRAEFFQHTEGTLEEARLAVAQTVSRASTDLQHSIKQACVTVAESEQTISTGTRNFQDLVERVNSASSGVSRATATSAARGEAGAQWAIHTMLQGLNRVADRLPKPAPAT